MNPHVPIVSIHVPLAEHDELFGSDESLTEVSIHVPLAEHDESGKRTLREEDRFNSRAPRGARPFRHSQMMISSRFNSRAPRGARRLRVNS